MCYHTVHEKAWMPTGLGTDPAQSHRAASSGSKVGEDRRIPRSFAAMDAIDVAAFSRSRGERGSTQTTCGAQAQVGATLSSLPLEAIALRSSFERVFDRPLDLSTSSRTDRSHLWRQVPCRSSTSFAQTTGLVLSEAAASRQAAGRGGHRRLDRARLGADKKNARRLKATLVFLDETGLLL